MCARGISITCHTLCCPLVLSGWCSARAQERHQKDEIYTRNGSVLVAINPYKPLVRAPLAAGRGDRGGACMLCSPP